jgi:hypothetical protein
MYVPSKVIRKKTLKKLIYVGMLKATDENSMIRICGFGSVPKCQGSTTLLGR